MSSQKKDIPLIVTNLIFMTNSNSLFEICDSILKDKGVFI